MARTRKFRKSAKMNKRRKTGRKCSKKMRGGGGKVNLSVLKKAFEDYKNPYKRNKDEYLQILLDNNADACKDNDECNEKLKLYYDIMNLFKHYNTSDDPADDKKREVYAKFSNKYYAKEKYKNKYGEIK